MRKSMIALAAAMALGAATVSTAAMAQHHGGGAGFGGGGAHMGGGGVHNGGGGGLGGGAAMAHGGAGFAGGGGAGFTRPAGPSNFGGNRGHFAANGARDHDHDRFRGRGFGFGGLYAFSGPGYYDDNGYDDYYGDTCWQRQLVPTPYGLQWRLVDVCQ